MLFNTHDFYGVANHFSMPGLSRSGGITESMDNIFCNSF